jgi:hypothetical protein
VEHDRPNLPCCEQLLGKLDTVAVWEIDIEDAKSAIGYGSCLSATGRLDDLVADRADHSNDQPTNRGVIFEDQDLQDSPVLGGSPRGLIGNTRPTIGRT